MALGSLEVELLSAILEYVDEESPNTTKSVGRVNKHLYLVARSTRYRRQTIDITEAGRLPKFLAEPEALRSIRYLTVIGGHGDSLEPSVLHSLAKLVRELANLRRLVWRYAGPIPLEVLDALHQFQPRATLQVYDWCRKSNNADHNDAAEIALAHSPALVSFQASIWNGPDLREAACKRIIANAPNLRYASVTSGISGCVIRTRSATEQAELERKEELFYSNKQPSNSLQTLTLDGYGLSKGKLDAWSRFLDFSALESLKCSRGFVPDKSYFELAPTLLKNLKHVSLNFSYNKDVDIAAAADNYLNTCSPLQTLSLWSWINVISLSSILKHGPTLKTLQLHERESTHFNTPRRLLTAYEVAEIRQACPLLRDFTMDIGNEEVSNQAIYDELAHFSLEKLQLYIELGIAAQILNEGRAQSILGDADELSESNSGSDDNPPSKRVKQGTAENPVRQAKHIWETIFGQRRTGARALDIKIGEWERKTRIGYSSDWVKWEEANRSYLKLRPHERDDRPNDMVMTCQGGLQSRFELASELMLEPRPT